MSLTQTPTLAELRLRFADLIKLGAQVRHSTALHATIDECLRQAFVYLINMREWSALRVRGSVELTHGQHAYDIPDGIPPGWIEPDAVIVRSPDNHAFRVKPGIDEYLRGRYAVDRDGAEVDDNVGLPLAWDVWDGQLQLYPAPDVTSQFYSHFEFWATTEPSEPWADGDRAWIDGAAHINVALYFFYLSQNPRAAQSYLAMGETLAKQAFAKQAPTQVIQVGPARVSRFNTGLSGGSIRPQRGARGDAFSSSCRAWEDGVFIE